ncbi:hypothetical protein GCM10027093_33810 [Paraburkholderia jirisanensis]
MLTSLIATAIALGGCSKAKPGEVLDEAQQAGRTADSFPQASEDYFHAMDRGVALTPDEIKGRNMWLIWTGGNDRFWDLMTKNTFGSFDLLKTLSSYPNQGYSRDNRWNFLGVVNEPCFEKATGPDPQRFGLWLDHRQQGCAPDPFENEQKYPGVKIGARGTTFSNGETLPVGSYFGYATGVLGLRLFPNPEFDEKAAKAWDPKRYYTDPSYYNRADLVRPYRVGMSCAFCHVGPTPVHPPQDAEHPHWEDLSSTVGAQYLWVDRVFVNNAAHPEGRANFLYQVVHSWRPGTLDTSLVSTDNINNARTMNALYDFATRLDNAKTFGKERLAGGGLNNKQLNDFVKTGPLTEFFTPPDTVFTPHVLKDGSDSLGALNRVYLNIGLFSEEWLLHFNPIVGGKQVTPMEISTLNRNSAYWQATQQGTPDMASFFIKSTPPDHLGEAPHGTDYLADVSTPDGAQQLAHGKDIFADTCARCHSSKLPTLPANLDLQNCTGPQYLDCFKRYWHYTQTDTFKTEMRKIVNAPDFLDNNYLSNDARVPVTLLRTNICSPLATNAIRDNIWDNFSSESYKTLPSVGKVTYYDPFNGNPLTYAMPGGGRGYTRVPSLIGLWSTAPYLLNNTVGPFNPDPSVAARVTAFNASIEQMLWPEKRDHDALLGTKVPGTIDRTTERSQIRIPSGFLPGPVQTLEPMLRPFARWLVADNGDLTVGAIPQGTPVDLLANLQPLGETDSTIDNAVHTVKVAHTLLELGSDLKSLPANASDDQLRKTYANVAKPLLDLSKCPDFVVNRGHYFGTAQFNQQAGLTADEQAFGQEPVLSDSDKRALIDFLKMF